MSATCNKPTEKPKKNYPSSTRHYCCVCSNYRGIIVKGKRVSLHRFPADKKLEAKWLRRIRFVSPNFKQLGDDRICLEHFTDLIFIKGKSIPSVFKLRNGETKVFHANETTDDVPVADDAGVADIEEPESSDSLSFACDRRDVEASILLHDYCGAVDASTFSKFCDKNEQTCVSYVTADSSTQTDFTPICRSISTQTEEDKVTYSTVGIQVKKPDTTYEGVTVSDDKCMFYTGIPNKKTLDCLFDEMHDAEQHTHRSGSGVNSGRPRILRLVDEFVLVLMRLRLGLLIDYLHVKLSFLVHWPSFEIIRDTMPNKFKVKYPKCRVIIDCTEIFCQNPQSQCNKTLLYSHYKSHTTLKSLIGISPSGVITFVSDLWSGNVSDKQLTQRCKILDLCQRGDSIMADKGFLISDLTRSRGINLIIPPLKRQRFTRRQVEEIRRIANLRIDVERAIERVKNFRILQGVMPITISPQVTKIWKICACLSNLQPPLTHDEDY